MGPPLRSFFEGEKPALLQQIDTEFEKVGFFLLRSHVLSRLFSFIGMIYSFCRYLVGLTVKVQIAGRVN